MARRSWVITAAVCLSLALASCGADTPAGDGRRAVIKPSATATGRSPRVSAAASAAARRLPVRVPSTPLRKPADLAPFGARPSAGDGIWRAAGRLVHGVPAVYETRLVPPGGSRPAGIAWLDTHLLAARLYSGSVSPGGGPYRYTARPLSRRALARNVGSTITKADQPLRGNPNGLPSSPGRRAGGTSGCRRLLIPGPRCDAAERSASTPFQCSKG